MTREKLILKNKDVHQNIASEISYYIDIGRKSYNNFIIHKYECDLDIAISSYEKALEIDPYNAEAHFKMASLLWEKGQIDIDAAIDNCKKAIEFEPDNIDAVMQLGYFYRAAGNMDQAIDIFRDAVKMNFMASAKPRIALGVTMIQKAKKETHKFSEVSEGLTHFATGILLLVNDKKSLHLLRRSVKEEYKTIKYRWFGKLLEYFKKTNTAILVYEKAANDLCEKEMFFELIGDIHAKNQNFLIAANYYRKAIAIEPSDIQMYYKLINVLDEEIDTKEIIDCYRALIELEPDNHSLIYNLGHIYLEDKNFFGAINCFKISLEHEPVNPYYHNSMAYALIQVNDFDGAINEYQEAINHSSDNTWASIVCQALAAIYYQAKGNNEAAIMAYQMALNFDPDCIECLTSIAEIHYDKGNYDSAISNYKKALKLQPENPQAQCNLGFVYWEKHDTESAIKHYQHAIALYPQYDIAYNNLGVAYLDGMGKVALGHKMFDMAIKNNPNYALAYYNKGRALEALGKKAKAADYYQMALDINTFTNEVNPDEIEARLSRLFKVD
jgi:tetratricopeptide (TPR) repeat protein